VWKYLTETFDDFDGLQILHISPERCLGRKLRHLPGYVRSHKRKGRGDITDLHEFEAESFDLIICNHVLEHIRDDARAMSETYRVARSGGRVLITVPCRPRRKRTFVSPRDKTYRQRQKAYGQGDHVRVYGMDIVDKLERTGFSVCVYPSGDRKSGTGRSPLFCCTKGVKDA